MMECILALTEINGVAFVLIVVYALFCTTKENQLVITFSQIILSPNIYTENIVVSVPLFTKKRLRRVAYLFSSTTVDKL